LCPVRKRLVTSSCFWVSFVSCVGIVWLMGEEGEEVSIEKEQSMGVYENDWLFATCSANWPLLRHHNSSSMPPFK